MLNCVGKFTVLMKRGYNFGIMKDLWTESNGCLYMIFLVYGVTPIV